MSSRKRLDIFVCIVVYLIKSRGYGIMSISYSRKYVKLCECLNSMAKYDYIVNNLMDDIFDDI